METQGWHLPALKPRGLEVGLPSQWLCEQASGHLRAHRGLSSLPLGTVPVGPHGQTSGGLLPGAGTPHFSCGSQQRSYPSDSLPAQLVRASVHPGHRPSVLWSGVALPGSARMRSQGEGSGGNGGPRAQRV